MTDDDGSGAFLNRIQRAASNVVSELGRRVPSSESSPLMDAAAKSLQGTLERWGRNPSLGRLIGGVRRDVLTGAGESIELVANPGVAGRIGTTARFFVGDEVVGEVALGTRDEVCTVMQAPQPGIYSMHVGVRGEDDDTAMELAGQRVLHVCDGRPVALVHAQLLFPDPKDPKGSSHGIAKTLRALDEAGFELAYFDVHEDNRYAEVYEQIERLGLPPAAVLIYAAKEEELATLGVEFVEMFLSTAVRRLRSRGVPVTTIVSEEYGRTTLHETHQLQVLSPAATLAEARDEGLRAQKEQAAELRRRKEARAPLDWRLDQTTRSERVEGNSFMAQFDNGAARRELIAALEQATSTIHLQLYIVRPSRFTDLLIVTLIKRARAGVRVRFLVDALYSEDGVLGRQNDAVESLRAEDNVEVISVAPIGSRAEVTVSRLKKRDHRKVVIVDGTRAFISGRNASDEYYSGFDEVPVHDHSHHDAIPWLDAHVEVAGPLVGVVQESFVEAWEEYGGAEVQRDSAAFPELSAQGAAAGRLVVHRGFADTNGLAMYEALMDSATKHIYIVNDFPFVPTIERAIVRALERGVRVQILTGNASARRDDGTFFPSPLHRTLFEYMVKAKLEPLLAAGVHAYEFVPPPSTMVVARGGKIRPYVHAKVVSVDGLATTIGSANLDATASYWESEANIVVQEATFASGVEAQLQTLIDGSFRLDLESNYWTNERTRRAVVAKLWPGTLYS